ARYLTTDDRRPCRPLGRGVSRPRPSEPGISTGRGEQTGQVRGHRQDRLVQQRGVPAVVEHQRPAVADGRARLYDAANEQFVVAGLDPGLETADEPRRGAVDDPVPTLRRTQRDMIELVRRLAPGHRRDGLITL